MLSPYDKALDPYPHRTIYADEELLIGMGYEFLGWANNGTVFGDERYKHCVNEAHNYHSAFPNARKSVQHTPNGDDVTQWCTICRLYWKVDMSG